MNDHQELEGHTMHDMQDGADGKGPDEVQDRVRRLIERAAASTPAMDFHREQFQQAGLRFKANIPSLHPVGLPKAFRAGMQPFGHWLNAPGFVGIEGMKAAMKKADPRDLWAMKPFSDVWEKRSLHPVGRLDTDEPSRGQAILSNPQFTIQLLKVHDDDAMVGVQWKTHHGPEPTVEAEVIGVRMVCLNLNLWGSVLGRLLMTAQDADKVGTQYSELLENAVARAPILCGLIEQADETPMDDEEAFEAIAGTGVGAKTALFASSMVDDTQ